MPPQTNVHADAPQTKISKGFLGFLKPRQGSSRHWAGQSSTGSTVRSLGQTWSSNTRGSARRPVWE